MAEISLQGIYLGYKKLSEVHLEAWLVTASGLELLRYSWSYILVFIFLNGHSSKDFSKHCSAVLLVPTGTDMAM